QSSWLAELVSTFAEQTHQQILQLETAMIQSDMTSIQKICHQLKGAAANLGAIKLTELCAFFEHNPNLLQSSDLEQIHFIRDTTISELQKHIQ
ncbi:MAG: Hpt domain-containing protein, partial [Bacteroidia bacterium]|nr:Hpt domain-containing protein [Bacteroidia bacterium]